MMTYVYDVLSRMSVFKCAGPTHWRIYLNEQTNKPRANRLTDYNYNVCRREINGFLVDIA